VGHATWVSWWAGASCRGLLLGPINGTPGLRPVLGLECSYVTQWGSVASAASGAGHRLHAVWCDSVHPVPPARHLDSRAHRRAGHLLGVVIRGVAPLPTVVALEPAYRPTAGSLRPASPRCDLRRTEDRNRVSHSICDIPDIWRLHGPHSASSWCLRLWRLRSALRWIRSALRGACGGRRKPALGGSEAGCLGRLRLISGLETSTRRLRSRSGVDDLLGVADHASPHAIAATVTT